MSLSGLIAWFKVRPKFVALLQLLFGFSAVMAGLFYVHSLHTSGLLLLPENFEAVRPGRIAVALGGENGQRTLVFLFALFAVIAGEKFLFQHESVEAQQQFVRREGLDDVVVGDEFDG